MMTYFDKNHDVHLVDDSRVLDVNFDALARSLIRMAGEARRARRRRRPLLIRGAK